MATEETPMTDHARQVKEFEALLDEMAEIRRECELSKRLVRQKIAEFKSFCVEARLYLEQHSGRNILKRGSPPMSPRKD